EPGKSSHKGDNGKVLVIGGGPYTGAPAIAASAALRTGCDIVRIASPQQSASIIAAMSPSFIVTELSCRSLCRKDLSRLSELSEAADAVLIGPGIGPGAPARSAAAEFISLCRKPMVIDADGLNAIAGKDMVFSLPAVLTPHRGEMARLLSREPDDETVMAFAKRTGSVVLLKGRVDMITDGTRVRYNRTGCAAMTVGGTGDALAGSVAGLMSKGMGAFDAACLAAYICGLAGERAFDRLSYGMTAPDVVESIPRVLKRCLKR
ncbi:MAG: NAD(P)H-hydrate dehydratase, partial [Candidatus Methanomethylophilaceae archaeon]|nr:NAD(P)H-hydrate dehydratase [Candidatus Methanomethylophilaceae archaeon]